MTDDETRVTFSDTEYDAIEAAVVETARGRWFLREYAKRNRNADTDAVLAALGKLEKAIREDEAALAMAAIRANLQAMAAAILRTKSEIGLLAPEGDDLKSFVDAVSEKAGPDEQEFQAVAEERIRHMLETLRYLEQHVAEMMACCETDRAASNERRSFSDKAGLAGGPPIHPGPHPSFLM